MRVSEKVMYLKGLLAGLDVNEGKEGKIYAAIVDALNEIAISISDLEEAFNEISEQVDEIDESLNLVEEDLYGEEQENEDDDSFEDEEDDELFDPEEEIYEVICPTCGDKIYLDQSMMEEGSMLCPNCGESLEFDFEEESQDQE